MGPIIQADYPRALAGKDVATLADYGLEPKRPTSTKSVDVKAAAAAKIKAGARPPTAKPT